MERRYEFESIRRSIAVVRRGELALRKETAAEVLDELIALRARHNRLVAQLRQLLDQDDA